MKTKFFKTFFVATMVLVLLCTVVLAACKPDAPGAEVDTNYEWKNASIADTSDLTSWADLGQTRQLELVAWDTQQEGGFKKLTAKDDVVSPEIQRVTGVKLNKEKSFDNGGVNADVAYQKILATGALPDIAYGQWVDPDEVYDLTELIDKYCPTIKARMPESVWNASNINGGQKGKVYAVPYGLGNVSLSQVDPEASTESCIMFNSTVDYYPYILVREDILLDAYPNALSTEEINEIFRTNGSFTEDQLFDVKITSAEQFRTEFLPALYNAIHSDTKYQIQADRWVEVLSCGYGSDGDTWDLMGGLIPKLIGATGNGLNTQQTYWDAVDQEVQLLMKEDFYLEELEEWVKLIDEGKYLNDDGIMENKNTIKANYNNGYYAIAYGASTKPDGDVARLADGSTVNYRRVYLKIEKNEHFEFFAMQEAQPNGVCIFKDSVKEDDLPQILRWLDYQCSRLCDKLVAWGPRSAGLFTEENGVRRFKDETLVNQMVYSTVALGDKAQSYNLFNGTADPATRVFTFFYQGGSKDHPKATYDLSKLSDLVYSAYSSAAVFPDKKPVGIAVSPEIWKWKNQMLEDVETVWGRRPSVEKALYQVLRSGNNFDKEWAKAVTAMDLAGWTDEYFRTDFQDAFLNQNIDYLAGFYKDL